MPLYPFLLHMLGIPGAGKTSFLTLFQELWGDLNPPFLLGFDQVMQSMPAWQAMEDKVDAYAQYELPARELGYQMLDDLIAQKQSILFDNGGSAASHPDLLRDAQQKGYTIVLVAIRTPVSIAEARVSARAVTAGQHTPMNYLGDRAEKLARLETEYRALTPHFYDIMNDGVDFAAFQSSCRHVATDIISRFR